MADLVIDSLRGGFDSFTPANALAKDACPVAENIDFLLSTLGGRRNGARVPVFGPPSLAATDSVTWMGSHRTGVTAFGSELWLFVMPNANTYGTFYRMGNDDLVWNTVACAGGLNSTFLPSKSGSDTTSQYRISAASLDGKFYICCNNTIKRPLVWDPSISLLRPIGLTTNAAPTGANTGGGTYAATTRYYRTRTVRVNASGVVLLRSEPSPSLTFTPSGAGTGVVVTWGGLNATYGEADYATHWEIEVSLDNSTFYRLARTVVATTTYTDSAATSSYSGNTLSDPVGSYTGIEAVTAVATQANPEFVLAHDARLIFGGDFTAPTSANPELNRAGLITWTPPLTDPLPGPTERLDLTVSPYTNADGSNGGSITGLAPAVSGTPLVYKQQRIFRMVKTGNRVGAYELELESSSRGAVRGSVIAASDEHGNPTSFSLDPRLGLQRYGARGLEYCGWGLKRYMFDFFNGADQAAHGFFHAATNKLYLWIAQATTPSAVIVVQLDQLRQTDRGVEGGISIIPPGSGSSAPFSSIGWALSSTLFLESDGGELPLAGFSFSNRTAPLLEIDYDGATDDAGHAFTATITTRPFALGTILHKTGVLQGAILGKPNCRALLTLVRDYGAETRTISVNTTTSGSETLVVDNLDDCAMAELTALQITITDDPNNLSIWSFDQIALEVTKEQS